MIGRRLGKKPHKGENPFKFFFFLDCHKIFNKERVQLSISSTTKLIQQNQLNNIQELNPAILIIKTLIQKLAVNYQYL